MHIELRIRVSCYGQTSASRKTIKISLFLTVILFRSSSWAMTKNDLNAQKFRACF